MFCVLPDQGLELFSAAAEATWVIYTIYHVVSNSNYIEIAINWYISDRSKFQYVKNHSLGTSRAERET